MSLYAILSTLLVTVCIASPVPSNNTLLELGKREAGPPPCDLVSYAATNPSDSTPGNGDPNQNYYNIQVSSNQMCTEDACNTAEQDSKSFTINFSFGSNSNFKPSWFQAGFGVTESWTTGNAYTCDGDPGQTVCVFQRVAHTAYSVSQCGSSEDCGPHPGPGLPVAIMRSPNANNQGGSFYCAYDADCQYQGYDFWGPNVCAGGPQAWCG